MKQVVMTEAHYKYLCSGGPKITWQDVQILERFVPRPTPVARAVWEAFSRFRRI